MKKIFLNIICLFVMLNCGWSQDEAVQAVKSDEYDHLGYMAYVDGVTSEDEVDHVIAAKRAQSYHLNANYEAEALWYSKALAMSGDNAMYKLKYAQALLASGRCTEAVDWYNKYMNSAEGGTRTFVNSCEELPASMIFGVAEVKPVAGLNSEHLDFAPVPVDGGMVFTSSRSDYGAVKRTDKWTKDNFTNLYFVKKMDDGSFSEPTKLFGKINKKYHDGVATMNTGGNQMYFTRNNTKGKNSKGYIDLKIYEANKDNAYWKNMSEVNFNMEDYSTCHPTLSKDGNTMVFASNRPGGMGGMDLWSTTKNGNTWSAPVNLGREVNSADDEIFPHVDKMGRLFFSSNGWAGAGGLDLFVCKAGDGNWSAPENLGSVMNSDRDDFGIWVSDDGRYGYLSSNRQGSMGGDDIYTWTAEGPPPPASFDKEVMIVDAATGEVIEGANVKWAEVTTVSGVLMNEDEKMTPNSGTLAMQVWNGRSYVFNVTKDGYEKKNTNASVEMMITSNGAYKIPMTKIAMVTMNGTVTEAATGNMVGSANVEMTNLCDGTKELYRSDASGKFNFDTKCGCDYKMVATKNGYTIADKTIKGNCEPKNITIAMSTERRVVTVPTRRVSSVGQVIRIKDLYYDYDKSFIRPDAATRLDKVVSLMRQYPSMKIELGSHTDARGNDEYNRNLSQRRADSAVKYIISKGIASSRLSSRGYGETTITNECANGVNCTDRRHEENRRTEIRITSIDNGVQVIYDKDTF